MMAAHERRFSGTDLAALAISAVAGGVSFAAAPGPYDHLSVILSGSLVAIILSATLGKSRTVGDNIAAAAAVALAIVPFIGFVLEANARGLECYALGRCLAEPNDLSMVNAYDVILIWTPVASVALAALLALSFMNKMR
jgi:hypothetical protein